MAFRGETLGILGWSSVVAGSSSQCLWWVDIVFLANRHYIIIILERPPRKYSTKIMIEDDTGAFGHLAGAYVRQNSTLVWKYLNYELAFNGKLWCVTGGHVLCQVVTGWDFSSPEFAWPYTDTLYIRGS